VTQLPEDGYQFGDVVVDVLNLRLTVSGVVRLLEPKSFRLLQFLVENRRRVVPKDEILNVVWEGVAVSDNALTRAVAQVRKALDDDPKQPRYIETIPTVGYRFVAPLEAIIKEAGEAAPDLPGPKTHRRKVFAWGAAGAVLVAAGIDICIHFYISRTPKLTVQDTIVLADFVNATGDAVFDGALRQGLAIQLEQSPFLKVIDDEQVQRDLRLMSLPPESRLTKKIAHDICLRDGAAATIDGSIASLGRNYVITLEAITCPTGATLAREQVQVEDKEHILKALGNSATAMRAKLGESLSSIERLNRPLEQATTSSLEALQSYSAGFEDMTQGRFLAAVPLFERAAALDPNFAMAYVFLANASYNASDFGHTCEYSRKAFSLIDRVSEFERVSIASNYYEDCTGEWNKAIDVLRSGSRTYPRFWGFHNNLIEGYAVLGRFEEAIKEGEESIRLQPSGVPHNVNLLNAYIRLDRFREAHVLAKRTRAAGGSSARLHWRYLEMAFAEGDRTAAEEEIRWFAGKPEEYLSFGLQAKEADALGQRRKARDLYKRASETAGRQNLSSVASGFNAADALADALVGDCRSVRKLGRPAFAVGLCGDAVQAEKYAADQTKLFPNGTLWNAVQLPEIRAAIELHRGQPVKTVELLAPAAAFECAYGEVPYLKGLALLRLDKGEEATVEFQKILDHKGANWGLYYSLSYLGLARGSAIEVDTAKAGKAYRDFFGVWNDADKELPILKEARAEYYSNRK
jgi:eukaryotic-like serine/threonine-protein kinase